MRIMNGSVCPPAENDDRHGCVMKIDIQLSSQFTELDETRFLARLLPHETVLDLESHRISATHTDRAHQR